MRPSAPRSRACSRLERRCFLYPPESPLKPPERATQNLERRQTTNAREEFNRHIRQRASADTNGLKLGRKRWVLASLPRARAMNVMAGPEILQLSIGHTGSALK
jgi:hypothetical protein